jgi:hypothetical protein
MTPEEMVTLAVHIDERKLVKLFAGIDVSPEQVATFPEGLKCRDGLYSPAIMIGWWQLRKELAVLKAAGLDWTMMFRVGIEWLADAEQRPIEETEADLPLVAVQGEE